MVNVEKVIYDLLTEKVPKVQWTGLYAQEGKLHGTIKQLDNSVKISTSSSLEHVSSVAVQVTFWANAPEELFPIEESVNEAMLTLGLKRNAPNHLADERGDNTVLYRSITLFNGVYDNLENKFYFN